MPKSSTQFPRHQVAEFEEDSKPEREKARKRRKGERRMRRDRINVLEVIEITDSDSSDSMLHGSWNCRAKKVSTQNRKAELRNSVISTPSQRQSSSDTKLDDVAAFGTSVPPVESANLLVDMRTPTVEVDATEVCSTDVEYVPSDDEVDERAVNLRSKLGSFVFSSKSQTPSVMGDPTQPSRATTNIIETMEETNTRKKRTVKSNSLYLDFSERQLDGLLVCVSCDLKWTVRKTAGHKIAHLRTCARKMRFTDETMKTLIWRGLKIEHAKIEDVKGQVQTKPETTFLEDATTGSKSRKTGKRRKESASSVRAITELQDNIRYRAKFYLNRTSSSAGKIAEESAGMPLTAQSSSGNSLGADAAQNTLGTYEDDEPPRTQALPKSKIPIASSSLSLDLMGDPPVFNSPCSSKLSIPEELLSPAWRGSALLSRDGIVDVVSPSSYRPLIPGVSHEYATSLSASEDLINQYVHESDVNDDASLKFEPGALQPPIQKNPEAYRAPAHDILCSSRIANAPSRESEKNFMLAANLDGRIIATDLIANEKEDPPQHTRTIPGTEVAPVMKMTKLKSRMKRNMQDKTISGNTNTSAMSDEDLFTKFRAMVLEDEALYRRILRYEPVRFDALVELVHGRIREHTLRSGMITNKLRTFLDNQAIHYYGSEIGGWNRR